MPVASYLAGASPYGALDMAGNIYEWTGDWYSKDYYSHSPVSNPPGPASGDSKVLRGGSWGLDAARLKTYSREVSTLAGWNDNIGFRCAASP